MYKRCERICWEVYKCHTYMTESVYLDIKINDLAFGICGLDFCRQDTTSCREWKVIVSSVNLTTLRS